MSEKGWNVWVLSRRQVSISAHIIKGSVEDHVAGKDPKLDERRRRRLAVIKRIIKSPKQQKGNDIYPHVYERVYVQLPYNREHVISNTFKTLYSVNWGKNHPLFRFFPNKNPENIYRPLSDISVDTVPIIDHIKQSNLFKNPYVN